MNLALRDLRENYCRNPDGAESPWCFTSDPNIRVGYCSQIPKCDVSSGQENTGVKSKMYQRAVPIYRLAQLLSSVRNYLKNLLPNSQRVCCLCRHIFWEPDASKLNKNYCRNPDDDAHGPWCYTGNPLIPWDYCPISRCEGDTTPTIVNLDHPVISCAKTKQLRVVNGIPTRTNVGWMVSLKYR
eukprot:bmy_14162T0